MFSAARIPFVMIVAVVSLLTAGASRAQEGPRADGDQSPLVLTNDDLPDRVSVSVLGTLTIDGQPSGPPEIEEIERLAALNEAARRDALERRPPPRQEPQVLVVRDDWYPYALFNKRCGFGLHCSDIPYPPKRTRPSPHQRQALEPPLEGYIGRPGPHLTNKPTRSHRSGAAAPRAAGGVRHGASAGSDGSPR
jgi:hypothetical protein